MSVITLLTDFGLRDSYVGVMKGAIAHVNPDITLIDLTHDVPPQDIAHARFVLLSAFPYFPSGTVHLAVVDPGVGSSRRGIAVAIGEHLDQPSGFLVGPDNGLFSGVIDQHPILSAVELTNSRYWRTAQTSSTFHGRDIFAPVAAHLASGAAFTHLGTEIDVSTLVRLPLSPPIQQPDSIQGCVQAVDHFGNLITNISAADVTEYVWSVVIAGHRLNGVQTYSDRPTGSLLALIGSHGWVEIAVCCGNASQVLNLKFGDPILITRQVSC